MAKSPYGSAFYRGQRAASSAGASAIVPYLTDLIKPTSVLDVGCGTGAWLSKFVDHGVQNCVGIDGHWAKPSGLIMGQMQFIEADLENPPNLNRHFDLAISFEVAEHIPETAASKFVRYLCNAAPVVAFSAAIPFQGGINHVNEQWPDYWVDLFKVNDFDCFDLIRPAFWNADDIPYYYRQNSFLFVQANFQPVYRRLVDRERSLRTFPLRVVHPDKYAEVSRHEGMGLKTVLRILPKEVWGAVKRRF